jgi:hypothetical protein
MPRGKEQAMAVDRNDQPITRADDRRDSGRGQVVGLVRSLLLLALAALAILGLLPAVVAAQAAATI